MRLLGECDWEVNGIVVQSIGQSIGLAVAFPLILRKFMRALVSLWTESGEHLDIGLRCFVVIEKALRISDNEEFFMWGLRRVYMGYFEHSGQVTWRTV